MPFGMTRPKALSFKNANQQGGGMMMMANVMMLIIILQKRALFCSILVVVSVEIVTKQENGMRSYL